MSRFFHRFDELNIDVMRAAYERKGYPFFTNGDYNLNIYGIRSEYDKDANTFNDVVGEIFKINGKWVFKKYHATTDPGTYWRQNLMNVHGTAILVPGFYRGTWKVGYHKGQYKALCQAKNITVYRDKNKNQTLEMGPDTELGMFGVNIHRATKIPGQESTYVDKWSAGCQVIAANDDYNEHMGYVTKAAAIWGPYFSYALFLESEVFPK